MQHRLHGCAGTVGVGDALQAEQRRIFHQSLRIPGRDDNGLFFVVISEQGKKAHRDEMEIFLL